MLRLINFLYNNRAFFTFLALELFCAWLVIQNSSYQNVRFFNSSNRLAASIMGFAQSTREYFSLREINRELSEENSQLRALLEKLSAQDPTGGLVVDSLQRFDFVSAKVINNSVAQFKNHVTINRGEDSGIRPGMAVISPAGAVGKVKYVSDHFAVLIPLLNIDQHVSSVLKRTGNFGTVQWDGTDPRFVSLLYIPRHVKPEVGDTVVTSGYNAIFPEGIMIGIVREVSLKDEGLFYDIHIELAQDFRRLSYVMVVRSWLRNEIDSLENTTIREQL